MFWTNYVELCKEEGKTPSGFAKELGITSGTVSGWKRGKMPSETSLQKIADYCGIDKWDLLSAKKTVTSSDGHKNASNDEMFTYVTSIFKQLSFENKIRAANELQSLLQNQLVQDDLKESE